VPSAGMSLNWPDVFFLLEPSHAVTRTFPYLANIREKDRENILYGDIGYVRRLRFRCSSGAGSSCPGQASRLLISAIDVSDPDAYGKEYAAKAQAMIKAVGGRFVAIGGAAGVGAGKVTAFDGEAPKRVIVQLWDNMEKINAWRADPAYVALRKIGDKYAKFHSFAVDGVAQ
jgi:uncharacterized protein (DUF1330 family)